MVNMSFAFKVHLIENLIVSSKVRLCYTMQVFCMLYLLRLIFGLTILKLRIVYFIVLSKIHTAFIIYKYCCCQCWHGLTLNVLPGFHTFSFFNILMHPISTHFIIFIYMLHLLVGKFLTVQVIKYTDILIKRLVFCRTQNFITS